ncbi:MAG: hypothetical protein KC591_06585, partial [Gemmatimonadetes bacterium]|nr:hypothetical protein [Gemmatimonadota bacterium]
MTSPARLAFLGLLCAALTPRPAAAQCTALEAELPTSPTGYTSPSIDGTRLAVGDPSAGGCQSCGEVDIFEFDGTDWVPTAVIP